MFAIGDLERVEARAVAVGIDLAASDFFKANSSKTSKKLTFEERTRSYEPSEPTPSDAASRAARAVTLVRVNSPEPLPVKSSEFGWR
jgi:hypothetical protein